MYSAIVDYQYYTVPIMLDGNTTTADSPKPFFEIIRIISNSEYFKDAIAYRVYKDGKLINTIKMKK